MEAKRRKMRPFASASVAPMSTFRENWLPNFVSSLLQLLVGFLVFEQTLRPWLRTLPRYFRHRRRDVTIQLTGQAAQITAGTFREVNVSDTCSLAPSTTPTDLRLQ
jgi:hypothetical protein